MLDFQLDGDLMRYVCAVHISTGFLCPPIAVQRRSTDEIMLMIRIGTLGVLIRLGLKHH